MSFCAGDILRLAPKGKQPRIRGWLLGTVDGSSEGVVPANYVKVRDLCSFWYSYLSRVIARMKQTKTLTLVKEGKEGEREGGRENTKKLQKLKTSQPHYIQQNYDHI